MVDNLSKAIEDETYQCKIPSNYKVKVTTQHPDTYRTLIRHLHSEHTIHHTYQMKHDTAYRVVIQDLHYSIPITDIKDELQKLGHPVRNIINIRHRVHKYPLSMFYVDLEPMSNNKEIYDLQFIHNMKITVEPPHERNTILQCTRCQLYGHSKSYCTRPYKCVKCGGNHMTSECRKTKDTPTKCALCSGEHNANCKGCAVYKELQQARGKPTTKHPLPATRNTNPPLPSQCPPLQPMTDSASYPQALRGNKETNSPDDLGTHLTILLQEFKTMFSQLIHQNSLILNMLTLP